MAITAGFFLGSTSGVAITTSVWLTTSYVGMALTSLATSALLGALSPKPAAAAQRGYETNVLGAGLDHTIIYGKTKVGGVVVYNEATGTDNKFLHRIIAVAGHEVESFDRIYIDDAYVDFSDLGASGNVGTVVDPDGTTSDRYDDKLRIQVAYGTPTQAAKDDLVGASDGLWTDSHKLSGIAYIYVRLAFDADVYPNGIPTFTAIVKGKKVYDPRTSTTAWSDNPALCVRDYLTNTGYGLGETAANIDNDLVIAAANVCDTAVGDDKLFTTNGSFTTGATPYDLLSSILPSMGGSLWYAQGKWRMKPAYWTTPVMFLDEDDLRSSIGVSTRHSRRDNFNVIKGKFSGPTTNWQSVDYKEVVNETPAGSFVAGLPYAISTVGTTDFTAIGATSNTVGQVFTATGAGTGTGIADVNLGVDNGLVSVADVDLLFTDNQKEARRLGRITLERNRQQLTITASFGLKALGLQVGDNVYITNSRFGWTNKAFEVLSWSFGLADDLDLQANMTLRETAESVFDRVDDGAAYEIDNTNLPSPFFVPAPSLDAPVVTTTINKDGTAVPAIDFSWAVSNSQVVDYYDFQWKLIGDTNYSSTVVEEPRFRLAPALSGAAYNYRVRAVNTLGIKSIYVSGASSVSTGNDTTIPKAPEPPNVSGGYAATTVKWTAPTQNIDNSEIKDLFQYEVYRGTSINPTTLVGRVAGTTFSDIGLNDSTTYYYRVKALDFTGNSSAYSVNGSATTNPALENGADGTSVLVVYADDASGTNQSLTAGSREYVQYYEYNGATPSLPVSGTFVKFIGGAGADGNSIFPIYADSAAGSNQSFDPSGKTFVTFYESTTTPTLPVSGQTFVEYVGEDGADGADGARGAGRWNIGVSSLPTTSSGANTAFVAAIGQPVDKDQAWFYTGTAANPTSQGVWLYNASTPVWIEQDEVIDGNLLVTGTVTANAMAANSITTSALSSGSVSSIKIASSLQSDNYISGSSGWSISRANGDAEFNDITVRGDIINLNEKFQIGISGNWYRFLDTGTNKSLNNILTQLGGAGTYVFILVGGGGSGAVTYDQNPFTATGGGAGGLANFIYEWNGSTALTADIGAGGAGKTKNGAQRINGSAGGASRFKISGTTRVTANGGGAGVYSNTSSASGGAGGTVSYSSASTFFPTLSRSVSGSRGGNITTAPLSSTGGGGINAFGFASSAPNGGDVTSTNLSSSGGGVWGGGATSVSVNRVYGATIYQPASAADYSADVVGGGLLSSFGVEDFIGGFGVSSNSLGQPSAGDGGVFSGGGGHANIATSSDRDDALAGDAGIGGGGGGALSDGLGISGAGGTGALFISRIS